jgi:hypothetical protein
MKISHLFSIFVIRCKVELYENISMLRAGIFPKTWGLGPMVLGKGPFLEIREKPNFFFSVG